jgi:hypothetical protein
MLELVLRKTGDKDARVQEMLGMRNCKLLLTGLPVCSLENVAPIDMHAKKPRRQRS